MGSIRDKSLLYHLTALTNLPSIFEQGLLSRSELVDFEDVADAEILAGRERWGLESYVPFHFFAGTPFDGRVQRSNRDKAFVFITVRRVLAATNNWQVMPRHPLAREAPAILDYADGIAAIDWELMDLRDYHNEQSKSVCMAECLSPTAVNAEDFCSIYVADQGARNQVEGLTSAFGLSCHVNVNAGMFVQGK